ncbi:hypothetical protein [Metasolibacillus sp.]|uniref:hypothetical protein n=1 Tax=Metasolibacillus sp. TaxID=2703680 RepID=UPI0025CD93A8|nr:hypothetical protein [Metasolibacillus sp.]MCT6923216.1 hypothetical protein [Metasolibacillus sp.]MCT6939479.1 hypothetical protein [Metasolibacillus sp.]
MLNDEWKEEHELQRRLDQFDVQIPEKLVTYKKSRWDRFITYLGSPAKDPLEKWNSTSTGYTMLRIAPIICGFVLAVVQWLSIG